MVTYAARAQQPGPSTAKATEGPAIATVGARRVSRAQYERRLEAANADFQARNSVAVPEDMVPMFRRQVLENLIRFELLILEAPRRGITASPSEAEEILKRDPYFNPAGRYDARKFEAVKASSTPTYRDAIAELRAELAGQKLERKLVVDCTPSDSLLRSVARRSLGRLSFDYLGVDVRGFLEKYPEPRERDVLDYYRSHAEEFHQSERAEISVIFVDRPPLDESRRSSSTSVQAWSARLRARADSALAALKSGASFERVADSFGGIRSHVIVLPGNFPGYWLGSASQTQAVFHTRPGTVMPEAVPSNPGYLLVRVDRVDAAHLAPLREVSPQIRQRLRDEVQAHGEDRELTPLYAQARDSLRGPAVKVRYATADTASMNTGEPSDAELDRYYRGHLADYSAFDSRTGTIKSTPLSEVRGDIRLRWLHERRAELANSVAEGLLRAWKAGRRDAELERSATLLRDIGPIPVGTPVDTGLAASIVTEAIKSSGAVRVAEMTAYDRGFVIYNVYETQADYRPTYEQARPKLRALQAERQATLDRAAARAWFDRDPSAWAEGRIMHIHRVMFPLADPMDVPLTRAEVTRFYHQHFDDYSSPEAVTARHILISPRGPGEAADRAARARADSVLRVLRDGADFATVARQVSDDPATRASGGDLGSFGRGVMLQAFERAAFELKPGETSELVRTREGYHIIRCTDHVPMFAQPFAWVYGNVGYDAAKVKADSLARTRADSVYRRVRSPAELQAAADKLGLKVERNEFRIGDRVAASDVIPYLVKLENVKPGHLYPGSFLLTGLAYVLTWVDSISTPRAPNWNEVADHVTDEYLRGASLRAVRAKLAELDSMSAAGWSLDSLGALWGGLVRKRDIQLEGGLNELPGARATFDSLAYGVRGGRALETGEIGGWCAVPAHYVRVRMLDRTDPDPITLARRMETDRRAATERGLRPIYEELSHRYGVQILDPELAQAPLPEPPPPPTGLP
jgi:parvulin-like peptidyl-prolyl isomerase